MTAAASKPCGGEWAAAMWESWPAAKGVGQSEALCGGDLVDRSVGQHLLATLSLKRAATALTSKTWRPAIINV
eukprot:5979134-Pleurochrysis_carterae.AAC.1